MNEFNTIFANVCQRAKSPNIFDAIRNDITIRPLVIYGAGGNCEFACFTCFNANVNITCVCDSNVSGTYNYHDKHYYKIITPQQLLSDYPEARVLISTWKYEKEIKLQLSVMGFPEEQIYFCRIYDTITTEKFAEKYLDGYGWAYDFFNTKSKDKVIDRMKHCLFGTPCKADTSSKDSYWTFPDLKVGGNEIYADCGVYRGDTTEEFISFVNGSYSAVYAFEPDHVNFENAKTNLSKYDNVYLINKGLWSSDTTLSFNISYNNQGVSSRITSFGTTTVAVTSLDKVFEGKSDKELPTLIKMDIEGAEKEALLGSANIVSRNKPKLIICAYHKPEDIYELPQTVLSIRDDYKFSLWQIGESPWDMVMYAF